MRMMPGSGITINHRDIDKLLVGDLVRWCFLSAAVRADFAVGEL